LSNPLDVKSALAQGGGTDCLSDEDCGADEICFGESPPGDPLPATPGECYEACQTVGDCTDDGYVCTDAVCVGVFELGETQEVFVCGHTYSEANCPQHLRDTHLVTTRLFTSDDNARSLGIHGECFDEDLGPTVPDEECVFTVEAVQYRRDRLTGATLFDAVCVDLDTNDSVPTCSPLQRDTLELGLGGDVSVAIRGEGGIAAGVNAAAEVGVDAGLGLSIPINIHRRFRYPMWRRFTGSVGGNILIDTGIGSVVARETVVFAHNGFQGDVTFFVTKPKGMQLTVGYKRLLGDASCSPDPCPFELASALEATSGLLGPGSTAGGDEFESDFDIQEVVDALNDETQAIQDITGEVKSRIEEKITATFEMLRGFLGSQGSSADAGERSVLVDEMMSLLRDRIRENLQEIRDIVRDLVSCPDN
jgi:hypothetical protein